MVVAILINLKTVKPGRFYQQTLNKYYFWVVYLGTIAQVRNSSKFTYRTSIKCPFECSEVTNTMDPDYECIL